MIQNIYLIGGAPRSGKSTIALELSKKLQTPYLSMDDFRSFLKVIKPTGISEDLYYDEEWEIEEFYKKYPNPAQVFELEKKSNKSAEDGIEALIESFWDWESVVIEGIGITPEFISRLKQKYNAKGIVIAVKDSNILYDRIDKYGLWDNEIPYDSKYKEIEKVWTTMYNDWFIAEASKYDVGLLYIDSLSLDTALSQVLGILKS